MNNVVDLEFAVCRDMLNFCDSVDTAGLSFGANLGLSHKGFVNLMPVLMLFDYMSASPSSSHAWIIYVLRFLNFPSGLLVFNSETLSLEQGFL